MADGVSRPVIFYFSFLVFVLICITGLSVMLIIATALQINRIKSDIEKATDRNATEKKINELLANYDNLKSQIDGHVTNYSALVKQLDADISASSSYYPEFFKQIIMTRDARLSELLANSSRIYDAAKTMSSVCGGLSGRLPTVEKSLASLTDTYLETNATGLVNNFYKTIESIILPVNATILVKPGWQIPTTLYTRSFAMIPNQNEFLVHNNNASVAFYPARPTAAEYKSITIATVKSAESGQFKQEPKLSDNLHLVVETKLPTFQGQKYGHPNLQYQEIVPYKVIQP